MGNLPNEMKDKWYTDGLMELCNCCGERKSDIFIFPTYDLSFTYNICKICFKEFYPNDKVESVQANEILQKYNYDDIIYHHNWVDEGLFNVDEREEMVTTSGREGGKFIACLIRLKKWLLK